MKKRVLINVEDKDIRVAILEDDQLVQLFVEQIEEKSIVGNLYKGRVEGVVAGLQAVFVNIGMERNAFLHFSDVVGDYILPGKKGGHPTRPTAPEEEGAEPRKCRELRAGDSLLVQVVKEPLGTKGARVTSNISLPGRYLVYLPYSDGRTGGVSRRIQDTTERRRLRSLLKSLDADDGGFIIRTAGLSQDEEEIKADVEKLKSTWAEISEENAHLEAPCLVYDDHDLIGRIVRDELTPDIEQLIVDSPAYARQLRQALGSMMPDLKKRVILYDDLEQNLFERYDVENQYQKALRRRVWLKSGGYIIVDETEALIAIDVNSGKFVGKDDQEAMILKTNLEAADTITRQLRLRDVGGIIVVDFIDMKSRENQRALVRKFKELLQKDRAKTTVGSLSELGLLEMTRKRVRQSLSKVVFRQCPYCQGLGRVLTEQHVWKNLKYEILAWIKQHPNVKSVRVTVHPYFRAYLEDEVIEGIKSLANLCQVTLSFIENREFHIEQFEIEEHI